MKQPFYGIGQKLHLVRCSMNKTIIYMVAGGCIFILLAQFVGPELPPVQKNPSEGIGFDQGEAQIKTWLRTACYDCHSMETNYPWYASVKPFSWLLGQHIRKGRAELNFTEWQSYPRRTQLRKLRDMGEELEQDNMPLKSYTLVHPQAKLSSQQRDSLIAWTELRARAVLGK